MSARDDLAALIEDKCRAIGHEPDLHLDAYRAEVLREAHDAIRADLAKLTEAEAFSYGAAYQQGMDWAARIVDQSITP